MSNNSEWPFIEAKVSNFWCQTDGDESESDVNRYQFAWKIKNYKDRPEQKGEYVDSHEFHVLGPDHKNVTRWIIRVYPKGCKDSDEGNICISIVNDSDFKVKVKGVLYLGNKDGIKEILNFEDNLGRGWTKENKNVSLADVLKDALTITAKIQVLKTDVDTKTNRNEGMVKELFHAFENKDSVLFDFTIKCGDASFECSKFMLAARSPVFKSMMLSNMIESQTNSVNIEDLLPEVVEGMLQYIHTGVTEHFYKLPRELLAAADRYQLKYLKSSCEATLVDSLDVENCISLLILSEMYNASHLRKAALQFAVENIKSISNSLDWKKELAAFPSLMTDLIESLMTMTESLKGDLEDTTTMNDVLKSKLKSILEIIKNHQQEADGVMEELGVINSDSNLDSDSE